MEDETKADDVVKPVEDYPSKNGKPAMTPREHEDMLKRRGAGRPPYSITGDSWGCD